MRLEAFDFDLPDELIALRPVRPRRSAKLLVSDGEEVRHSRIAEIGDWLRPGDLLIFNDTRVLPARLSGWKTSRDSSLAVPIEITLFNASDARTWDARMTSGAAVTPGDEIEFGDGLCAQLVRALEGNKVRLRFNKAGRELTTTFEQIGQLKLPPYIAKHRSPDADDARDYQTVFARQPGSLAAPSASLPFDQSLVAELAESGVEISFVTLHIGAATFQKVSVETIEDHRMHAEWGSISGDTVQKIKAAKSAGCRVLPVGTTSMRLIETAAQRGLGAWEGGTEVFITPGYQFLVSDGLITNFHLPRSTLFMLVAALIGLEQALKLYEKAIEHRYRFLSYGDSCLLFPNGIW